MQGENLIETILTAIQDDIREMKTELRETRKYFHDLSEIQRKDISELKIQQTKCSDRWATIGKVVSGSGVLGAITFAITQIFNPHK